jgi:hypothetical protein
MLNRKLTHLIPQPNLGGSVNLWLIECEDLPRGSE